MKKTILHIIPTLDRSGAEKQMAMLACGLSGDEFDVHVCALTRGGPLMAELRDATIPTVVIGKRWKVDPWAFGMLRRHIAKLQPDLVHTWIFAADSYGRAAAVTCGVKRIVCGLRCVDTWKGGAEFCVDRVLARRTDRFVANSPGVKEFYVQHRLPADEIDVVPNAIQTSPPSSTTRRQLLAELGLPEHSRLIGLVGRLALQKKIKDAIWAADLLKVIRDDVHLLIIGDGPHEERLRKFRDQVEIRDKVHFLGHRSDVGRLMPHFDLLWSTSAFEGQSNSILEAMAAGVPVVATDILGTQDLVVDGETGYLVRPGHRAGFAARTDDILNNVRLAERLSNAAKQRAVDKFSVERMIQSYADLYRSLLA